MTGAAKKLSKARRHYDPEAKRGPGRFPLGLSGFGQRWADREFRAEDACAELLELVSDLPSLRGSARELVDIWLQSGRISEDEAQRMRRALGGGRRRPAEDHAAGGQEASVAESEILATDSVPAPSSERRESRPAERVGPERPSSPQPRDFAPGDLIAGRYELVRRVDDGSMGIVYQAIDRDRSTSDDGPHVALKLLSNRLSLYGPAIRALQQEARTGKLLDHPQIVKTYGLERDGSAFFIVMEWCPGVSLARWLDDHPGEAMPRERVVSIVADLGAALACAHARGVVHADVKPGNIILDDAGSARLCDFGVARLDAAAASGRHTFDAGVLRAATPAYASAQLLEGLAASPQDDIYSLAALTYRLLAGRRAFGGHNAREAAELGLKPETLDGLEAGQWAVLESALSASPEDRPRSVEDFVSAFCRGNDALAPERAAAAGREETIRAIRPWVSAPGDYLPSRIPRRRPVLKTLAGLVLLTGSALVASYFWLGEDRVRMLLDRVPALAEVDIPWLESPGSGGEERVDPGRIAVADGAQPGEERQASDTGQGSAATTETPGAGSDSEEAGVAQSPASSIEGRSRALAIGPSVALPPDDAVGQGGGIPDGDVSAERPAASSDEARTAVGVSLELGGRDRRPDVASVEATENEGAVTVTLERSETGTPLELDIRPVTREEGLEPLQDLFPDDAGRTVSLAAGARSHALTIELPDDDLITGTRKYAFFIVGSGADVADVRTLARIDLTVRDDELVDVSGYLPPGTVAFTEGSVSATEGGGAAEIRLVRFGGYEQERIARFVVVGQSAVEGEDYAAGTAGEVRFAPGEDNVRLFIPIINDNRPEAVEQFRVVLDDPRGPIGSPSQLTVRILDDDR